MDLTQLYNFDADPVGALDQAELNKNSAQLKFATDLQSAITNQYKQPLGVQQQFLNNETTEAQLPGVQADTRTKVRNDQFGNDTYWMKMDDAQRKHALSASNEDLNLFENQAQRMAYDKDPKISAEGRRLLSLHKDILKQKEAQAAMLDRQAAIERMRQEGLDRRTAAVQAAKLKVQNGMAVKPPKNAAEAYQRYYQLYQQETDPVMKEALGQMVQEQYNNWVWEKSNKPVDPNAINVPNLGNLPQAQPTPAPGSGVKRDGNKPYKDEKGRIVLD